mmetsp:Transcript_13808/g.55500  ORF Transcript_13808/g.55500 Transcript_13808/m.55500 type:complete len:150 (-) Transcript_13808:36-485(-)
MGQFGIHGMEDREGEERAFLALWESGPQQYCRTLTGTRNPCDTPSGQTWDTWWDKIGTIRSPFHCKVLYLVLGVTLELPSALGKCVLISIDKVPPGHGTGHTFRDKVGTVRWDKNGTVRNPLDGRSRAEKSCSCFSDLRTKLWGFSEGE